MPPQLQTKMPMCFTQYIAVRSDCGGDAFTPESGLYVNDLEGINIYTAGDMADAEFTNGINLLQSKRDFAIEKVKAKMGLRVSKYLRLPPLLSVDNAGEFNVSGTASNDYLASAAGVYRGVEVCISERVSHGAQRIYIRTVQVLANTTALAQTIRFTDYLGNVVHTESVDLTAGQISEVSVNMEFSSPRIWVNMEGTPAFNDSRLTVNNCKGCGGISTSGRHYSHAYVRGYHQDGSVGNQTYGLAVQFDIACSREEILCRLKGTDTLGFLMLYATGIEIAQEAINSDRFNTVTNLRGDEWEALRDRWQREYDELWEAFADNIAPAVSQYGGECATCKRARIGTMVL